METPTRAPRGKTVAVTDHIQALILKKAVGKYVTELEDSKSETSDALVSNADIVMAAEELLESIEGLSFFHKADVSNRVKAPASKSTPSNRANFDNAKPKGANANA